MDHIDLPALDVGVVGLIEEMLGNFTGNPMAVGWPIEEGVDQFVDFIELQVDLMGKAVIIFFLFPEGLEKILLEQTSGLVVGGKGGLGKKGALVPALVAHTV